MVADNQKLKLRGNKNSSKELKAQLLAASELFLDGALPKLANDAKAAARVAIEAFPYTKSAGKSPVELKVPSSPIDVLIDVLSRCHRLSSRGCRMHCSVVRCCCAHSLARVTEQVQRQMTLKMTEELIENILSATAGAATTGDSHGGAVEAGGLSYLTACQAGGDALQPLLRSPQFAAAVSAAFALVRKAVQGYLSQWWGENVAGGAGAMFLKSVPVVGNAVKRTGMVGVPSNPVSEVSPNQRTTTRLTRTHARSPL
jgi:hypothetical protein